MERLQTMPATGKSGKNGVLKPMSILVSLRLSFIEAALASVNRSRNMMAVEATTTSSGKKMAMKSMIKPVMNMALCGIRLRLWMEPNIFGRDLSRPMAKLTLDDENTVAFRAAIADSTPANITSGAPKYGMTCWETEMPAFSPSLPSHSGAQFARQANATL